MKNFIKITGPVELQKKKRKQKNEENETLNNGVIKYWLEKKNTQLHQQGPLKSVFYGDNETQENC